jgi:HlyD family secretion protein
LGVRQGTFRDRLARPAITRQHVIVAALGLLALILLAVIANDVFFPKTSSGTQARTFSVTRGTVESAVTATGTVVPASQQNVGFRVSGQLTEVDVKVGDHVTPGEVMAKVDPTTYQTALDQANASLQQAQATLGNTLNGNAVATAQHSLDSAQRLYSDTINSVNLTNQQDASAVAADQEQLSTDQAGAPSAGQLSADQAAVNAAQDQVTLDNSQFQRFQCFANPPPNPGACPTGIQLQRDQMALSQAQQKLSLENQAATRVTSDQQKLSQDQLKATSDQINGQKQLDSASSSVTQAQDQLNSQTIQRPNTILQQEAQVSSAAAQVQTAQNNLDYTTLTAPVDGTVMSLSGAVGESVGSSGGLTSLSPGSNAPAPSSSSGSSGGASGASGSSGSSGGSSAFAVLGNIAGLQVVAPFAEADAARVQGNQAGTVTFDAVPGLSIPAHVLAVAVSSTTVSNVTNYYVTMTLDDTDQRLKSGMTANANVVVSQASNVLEVPNSAITRLGGQAYVTVLSLDGKTQTRVPVETGTVGDSNTEITSGVSEGQKVVLPQLRLSTTGGAAGGAGGRGGAFGGGGGGGVRVG